MSVHDGEADAQVALQMLGLCEKIDNRIASFSIDESSFVENDAYFDMLLMPLFQIGELAGALSDKFTEDHPQIPWHAIVGFRNIIAHDYGVVDPLWAWNTVTADIPVLKKFLSELSGIEGDDASDSLSRLAYKAPLSEKGQPGLLADWDDDDE